VRPRIENILRYAKAMRWRSGDNPAALENLVVHAPRAKVNHHTAMPWQEVPAFMATLAGRESVACDALRFLILTACRNAEVGHAKWCEIDFDTATWTIPETRAKTGRQHVVPLSDAAITVLKARKAQELPRHGGFVFPSRNGNAGLAHAATNALLERLDCKAAPHGFRSSFRDWCAEHHKPHDVAEFCLAHVKGGTEGAYFRTTMVEARRVLMREWAEFCMTEN
jgi:integrase